MTNKIAILWALFSLFLSSGCTSGGGGDDTTIIGVPETYTATYIYPENTLQPGDGVREVAAIGVGNCLDSNGHSVDVSKCQMPKDPPKQTQKSPAGHRPVNIDGAASAQEYVGEGESQWVLLPQNIICDVSHGYTSVGVMCKIPGYEPIYSGYSSPHKNACL